MFVFLGKGVFAAFHLYLLINFEFRLLVGLSVDDTNFLWAKAVPCGWGHLKPLVN